MTIDEQLKNFSQSLYGAIVALEALNSNTHNLVDTSALYNSISRALAENSNLGFNSGISRRNLRRDSIRLNGENETQVFELTSQCLINIYFIHLVTIFEATICEKFSLKTGELKKSINALQVDSKYEWAKKAVHQMRCIRNILIHSNGKWNQNTLQEMQMYVSSPITITAGSKVSLCFEDLFRYRRAVRTFVNNATK